MIIDYDKTYFSFKVITVDGEKCTNMFPGYIIDTKFICYFLSEEISLKKDIHSAGCCIYRRWTNPRYYAPHLSCNLLLRKISKGTVL
jgi:hypothetical protein